MIDDIDACFQALDDALAVINDMKDILQQGGDDSPLAFLEAGQDAQHHLARAIHGAIASVLG